MLFKACARCAAKIPFFPYAKKHCPRCVAALQQEDWRRRNPSKVAAQGERRKAAKRAYQAAYQADPIQRERNRLACKAWREARKKAQNPGGGNDCTS